MDNTKISIRQLQILVIIDVFGIGVISLPRIAAQFASNDGWLLIIGAAAFALLYAFIICSIAELFPQETFVRYSKRLTGNQIGTVLSSLLAARIIISAGIELRIFCEIVGQTMLYKTPHLITGVIMVALSAYVAFSGYIVRARLAEMLVYVVLIPIFIIFAFAAVSADYTNLLPLLKSPPVNILMGSFFISFAFRGVELTLLVFPLVDKPNRIKKSYMKAIIIAGAIMLLTTTVTLLRFGAEGAKAQLWPVIQMMDAISLPGKFFERLDAFVLSLWLISVFISLSASIFFSSLIFGELLRRPINKYVLQCAAIVVLMSILPRNTQEAYKWLNYSDLTFGAAYMILVPSLLLIIARLRGIGEWR